MTPSVAVKLLRLHANNPHITSPDISEAIFTILDHLTRVEQTTRELSLLVVSVMGNADADRPELVTTGEPTYRSRKT